MKAKVLWMVTPLVIAVLAIAAVALAPTVLNSRSPSETGNSQGTSPPPSEPTTEPPPAPPASPPPPAPSPQPAETIPLPTWHVGDRWTYNVSLVRAWDDSGFHGVLTKSVSATVSTHDWGDVYNVTIDGTFTFTRLTASLEMRDIALSDATVTGYAWYRTSDLAKVLEVRTLRMGGTFEAFNRTFEASYTMTVTMSFDPPLAVWQFPLEENATWNVTSNATVRYSSAFQIAGDVGGFTTDCTANVTFPVRFLVRTGSFVDVTTAAGTFRALPVMAYRSPVFVALSDRIPSDVLNATEEPILLEPRPFAQAWFSAQVGNVVKAMNWDGYDSGVLLDVELVSYARA